MTRDEEKAFNARKFAALDQMRREVGGSTYKVVAELISRLDARTGEVFPCTEAWLAQEVKLGKRTVKRAIAELEEGGYFKIRKVGRENRYQPVLDPALWKAKAETLEKVPTAPPAADQQGPTWPLSETQQGPNWHQSKENRGQNVPQQGPKSTDNRGQNGPLLPLEEPLSLPLPAGGRAGATPDGAAAPTSGLPAGFVAAMQAKLGEAYAAWFGDGKVAFVSEIGSTLTLAAHNRSTAAKVKTWWDADVIAAWQRERPAVSRLEVIVVPRLAAPAPEAAADNLATPNVAAFGRRAFRGTREDAAWMRDVGTGLVGDRLGKTRDPAAAELTRWLQRAHNDAAGLKQILIDAAAQGHLGDRFKAVVKDRIRRLVQQDQKPLQLDPVSVRRSAG
jgi:hypothetical protein